MRRPQAAGGTGDVSCRPATSAFTRTSKRRRGFPSEAQVKKGDRIVHGDAVAHNVTVELDLWPGVLPVKADNVQLQQVILNLMLNAFSAMSGTGQDGPRRVIVRTSSTDASNVLIEVQDSGTGIAAEKLESIFDPFVTSKPEGLGMGLSICRSIVERHHGRITVANNPDRGAKFSIRLPATHE